MDFLRKFIPNFRTKYVAITSKLEIESCSQSKKNINATNCNTMNEENNVVFESNHNAQSSNDSSSLDSDVGSIEKMNEFQNILINRRSDMGSINYVNLNEVNDIISEEPVNKELTQNEVTNTDNVGTGDIETNMNTDTSSDITLKVDKLFCKQLIESTILIAIESNSNKNIDYNEDFTVNKNKTIILNNELTQHVTTFVENKERNEDLTFITKDATIIAPVIINETENGKATPTLGGELDYSNETYYNEVLPQNEIIIADNIEGTEDVIRIYSTDSDNIPLRQLKRIKQCMEIDKISQNCGTTAINDDCINFDDTASNKNIEIISISSENDSKCTGYDSFDFEFITENEAKQDGFIINVNRPGNVLEVQDPGEGTSKSNEGRRSNNYLDRTYRNNHVVPEDDGFYNLFQGVYDPRLQYIHFNENKSIHVSAMNAQFEGLGFDRQLIGRRYVPDSSDEEFEGEAKETVEKIISMYPRENRKRRRTRRRH